MEAIAWADAQPRRWAFTLANAGACQPVPQLGRPPRWRRLGRRWLHRDWSRVKDGKQGKFLMYESFPWGLVGAIAVHSDAVAAQVAGILGGAAAPTVAVRRDWYY